MKRLSRKLIAAMLALMFIVTAVPVPAHAASTPRPSRVTVTQVVSKRCNTVTVKWKPSSKKNLDGYYVYYRHKTANGWSKWTRIKAVGKNTTSFTHKSSKKHPIKAGTQYQYTVRGYSKRYGTKSPYRAKTVTTHKHSYVVSSKTDATCTKDGKTVKTCKWCGKP